MVQNRTQVGRFLTSFICLGFLSLAGCQVTTNDVLREDLSLEEIRDELASLKSEIAKKYPDGAKNKYKPPAAKRSANKP